MNPMDRIKEKGLEQAVGAMDIRNHPLVEAIATIISQLEHDQAHALATCIDAADLELPVAHDIEDRREQLLDTAEAVSEDDLKRYWFEDLAEIDNGSTAQQYAGLDGDEWREQLRTWYSKYYDLEVVDKPLAQADPEDIGDVAALHVQNQYDVDLEEWVAGVVNWERREALEHLLAGNIQSYTRALYQVADAIEDLQDERDRLQERVHELDTRLDAIDESSPDNGEE